MTAADLITDPSAFITGTLYRGPADAQTAWDCLGALLWAWPVAEQRRPIAKRVFDLCLARFDHKRLGRLDHGEAVELLRGAGA